MEPSISENSGDTAVSIGQKFADLVAVEHLKLERREKDLKEREEAWEKISPRFNVSQLSDPIVLNVGGEKFSTSLETLSKIPNTYFSNMVSGRWQLKLSADGSVFIDRSPMTFEYVLQYLRNPGYMSSILKHLSALELLNLENDCEFFALADLLKYVIFPLPCIGRKCG